MTLGIGISGGLQIVPLDLSDNTLCDLLVQHVMKHCQSVLQIDATFEGLIDGKIEIGLNGKTYTLKLKIKVRIGDAYVVKIVLVKLFFPFVGFPSVVSFEYLEEINI
uniref:Uncharacterized protein n=1 Tax=Cucumis sativus TaxID=3659 RepID=A0A0A0KFK8_CUCSA